VIEALQMLIISSPALLCIDWHILAIEYKFMGGKFMGGNLFNYPVTIGDYIVCDDELWLSYLVTHVNTTVNITVADISLIMQVCLLCRNSIMIKILFVWKL